jgi:hypothetical protein
MPDAAYGIWHPIPQRSHAGLAAGAFDQRSGVLAGAQGRDGVDPQVGWVGPDVAHSGMMGPAMSNFNILARRRGSVSVLEQAGLPVRSFRRRCRCLPLCLGLDLGDPLCFSLSCQGRRDDLPASRVAQIRLVELLPDRHADGAPACACDAPRHHVVDDLLLLGVGFEGAIGADDPAVW